MASDKVTILELILTIRSFAKDRDWEQFHAPKNLSMALATEAGELMEHFLWCESEKSFEVELFRRDYFTTTHKTLVSEIGAVLVL